MPDGLPALVEVASAPTLCGLVLDAGDRPRMQTDAIR